LALNYGGGQRMNPASLAFEEKPFGLAAPSVGLRTGGLSGSKVQDAIKNNNGDAAASLLRQFSSRDTTIGLNGDFSVRLSKFELSVYGAGKGYLQPNDAVKAWDGTAGTAPVNSRVDLITGAYYALPAISAGVTLPMSAQSAYNYGVGVRVKTLHGIYSHYIADKNVLDGNNNTAPTAPEMNGKNTLTKNSAGADVGILMQPRGGQGLAAALLVTNLVNPSLKFDGTDRNGNAHQYKLTGTTLSAGLGLQHKATALAADIVDITGATEKAEVRLGVEQRILNTIALRGGYSSHTGYTVGLGIFGFGIAAGKNLPLEVSQSLKF
jgi:hypothetical protein